jgi:hypothetical protein
LGIRVHHRLPSPSLKPLLPRRRATKANLSRVSGKFIDSISGEKSNLYPHRTPFPGLTRKGEVTYLKTFQNLPSTFARHAPSP